MQQYSERALVRAICIPPLYIDIVKSHCTYVDLIAYVLSVKILRTLTMQLL